MGEALKEQPDTKPKNVLAVFEHVKSSKVESPRKFNFNLRTDSPISDCSLVIDDGFDDAELEAPRKRTKAVRMKEEPLNLKCGWNNCSEVFNSYKMFMDHVNLHILIIKDEDVVECLWTDCNCIAPSVVILFKHVSFHGYHTKLKNIGQNVLARIDLPDCLYTTFFEIPEQFPDYNCKWENCNLSFITIYEFYEHVHTHIYLLPKATPKGEFIRCGWSACKFKCQSQYKMSDHVKTHTNERLLACPTCGNMYSTKTKFSDHRNRQLPIDLQSYQCSQCSKLFPSERLLRDHMRAHINHYKCSMCDMTCPKPSILAVHIRYRHLNERPYKCNLCDHACKSKENLEEHLISHCAEKLMACEKCDFRCRSVYGLGRHYQKAHGVGCYQKYECHICQKSFNRGNYLTKHLIKTHGFNWPSGHSRFRYKEDTDGIYRLQTVRYESLEVTEEMIKFKSMPEQAVKDSVKYDLKKEAMSDDDQKASFVLMISESGEQQVGCPTDNNILITIDDVDEKGHILKTETVESSEIVCATKNIRKLRPRKKDS